MRNPWLDIPLDDYEQHMALPQVGQAQLIADQLHGLLAKYRPSSVAIIGCAGGNGLDRMAGIGLSRVVGVDVNPRYVEEAARRHGNIPGLELYAADIETPDEIFAPVDLIYAALLFEYVDAARVMHALKRYCQPDGVLATLLQLPHASIAPVSPSPYLSLQSLEPAMRLVSPLALRAQGEAAGFRHESAATVVSPAGKHFALEVLRG